MLLGLIQFNIGLLYIVICCTHVHIQPIQLLILRLHLNIDVFGYVLDVSHHILNFFNLHLPFFNDYFQVLGISNDFKIVFK